MPDYTLWMPPSVAVEADGIVIYHTYRNDDAQDPYEFWYTQDPEDPYAPFDIRVLAATHADRLADVAPGDHPAVLRRLIAHRILRPLPDPIDPTYRLTCPRCGPNVRWTVHAVTLAPETPIDAWGWIDPDAVTVTHIRCAQCQQVYPLANFEREPVTR